MTTFRILWTGFVVHFKITSRSPFAIGVGATWPIVNATLAYFMYSAGGKPQTLLYASLGSAVAGIFSMIAIDASGAIQRQRFWGTLELLVAAPVRFALVLGPFCSYHRFVVGFGFRQQLGCCLPELPSGPVAFIISPIRPRSRSFSRRRR